MTDQTPRQTPRKPTPPITCGGCTNTWTALTAAHCGACHHTFSGVRLFDIHRRGYGEHGSCAHPEDLRDRTGNPICEYRDGMWRFPEMTDAEKAARFGTPDAA